MITESDFIILTVHKIDTINAKFLRKRDLLDLWKDVRDLSVCLNYKKIRSTPYDHFKEKDHYIRFFYDAWRMLDSLPEETRPVSPDYILAMIDAIDVLPWKYNGGKSE